MTNTDHITDDQGRRWDRTMNASLWAQAFCTMFPGVADEDLMLSWFANAIMAGWDHRFWTPDIAISLSEYHEDEGEVLWWKFPVDEAPWCGTPMDNGWPGYHTHYTRLPPCPLEPS